MVQNVEEVESRVRPSVASPYGKAVLNMDEVARGVHENVDGRFGFDGGDSDDVEDEEIEGE